LHFVSNSSYAENLIKIGIPQKLVYNHGALAVENTARIQIQSLPKVKEKFGINHDLFYLFTFHPVTTSPNFGLKDLKLLTKLLVTYCTYPIYFTKANIDNGGVKFNQFLRLCERKFPNKFYSIKKDLNQDYLSILQASIAIIGNSSSGVIEAPLLNVPSINFGNRQKGRVTTPLVYSVNRSSQKTRRAIRLIEKTTLTRNKKLFGNGQTSQKILETLLKHYRKNYD
jgi:UDP-hydrolysing UDP-N-acetyl-D-glucosamine 2-epimerase